MTATYTCTRCGKSIEEGDDIAILGEAPPSGLTTPIGRAEKIIEQVSQIYCKECLTEVVENIHP